MKKKLLIGLSFLAMSCGGKPENSSVKITGGQEMVGKGPNGMGKHMVALAMKRDFHGVAGHRSAFCSGSIIGPNLILTAAHCAYDPNVFGIYVVFGNSMTSAAADLENSTRTVVRAVKHPGFPDRIVERWGMKLIENDFVDDPEKWLADFPGKAPDDIAVLQFDGVLPEGYEPITLADTSTIQPNEISMAGYGITKVTNVSDTGVLRYIQDVKVFPESEETKSRHWLLAGEVAHVKDIQSGGSARGACPGDSGSPALHQNGKDWIQLGVLSLGELGKLADNAHWAYCLGTNKDKPEEIPGNYYTDIRSYKDWINDTSLELLETSTLD